MQVHKAVAQALGEVSRDQVMKKIKWYDERLSFTQQKLQSN